eukprot:gene16580-22813_t
MPVKKARAKLEVEKDAPSSSSSSSSTFTSAKTFLLGSGNSGLDDVIHVCGVAAIALVGLRVALPILSKLVMKLKGGNNKSVPEPVAPLQHRREIIAVTLPCSVREFYDRVVSSQTDYMEQLHSKIARHEAWLYGWKPAMVTPPPTPPPGDCMLFATAMNMLNIPFKDCFTVNTAWLIKPMGDGTSCHITVNLKVNFVKSCMVSGIIRGCTARDISIFYKAYFEEAAAHVSTPGGLRRGSTVRSRGSAAGGTQSVRVDDGPGTGGGASTLEVTRHMRVVVVVCIILGSLVHQLAMHQQFGFVPKLLGMREG